MDRRRDEEEKVRKPERVAPQETGGPLLGTKPPTQVDVKEWKLEMGCGVVRVAGKT